MSRHSLRHDKTCLNCGFIVGERYCSRCGQENLEPTENIGHLVRHFFEDITHFDGKLFVTLKELILHPGFLTREYVAGRRMTYLNPIRMYIFISAIFFLVLFAGGNEGPAARQASDRRSDRAAQAADSTQKAKGKDESVTLAMSSAGMVVIDIVENKYNTFHEYDSVQKTLPDSSRDKGIMPWVTRSCIRQKQKHGGQGKIHIEVDVHHDAPKIMFVLLPLFALYVGWFYSRRKYYYVNHAIFSVHYHCFVFLLLLITLLLDKLLPGNIAPIIAGLVSLVLAFIYLVAALRGMYRQSFWLSLLKGFTIGLIYSLTVCATNTLLMVWAFMGM